MGMKVLIVGGGGREHAIATCVAKSPKVDKIYCAPGNAGIGQIAECVPIGAMEFDKLVAFAKEKEIEKEVEEEKVNVCKAIQGIEEKGRIAGLAEGRAAGLAEGKEALEREQKLTKFLLCDNRSDDLKRALDDPAFRQKLLEEYGID